MNPSETIKQQIRELIGDSPDSPEAAQLVEDLRLFLHQECSGCRGRHPINLVRWVPVQKVVANDYNPNSVAKTEMRLLATSIRHDGYTQPVVVVWDEANDRYVIVDGFHRTLTMKSNPDVAESTGGLLPVVVLSKEMNDRMSSTVRHNRARGKHSVAGMSNMVFEMLNRGWPDERICNELGMEPEELVRLKHITGFSKLFENAEFNKAWTTKNQLEIARRLKEGEDSK